MSPIRTHLVYGARPNLPKVAALHRAALAHGGLDPILVDTRQHAHPLLADELARDLGLPPPHRRLPARAPTGATARLAQILTDYDTLLAADAPELVVVVGDVDSTLACALAAARREIPLAHVEAGLRGGGPAMLEEQNRRMVDVLAQRLYTHSDEATDALLREGVPRARVVQVGNVMIDTLLRLREAAHPPQALREPGLLPPEFGLVTLHRPDLVDDPTAFARVVDALAVLARRMPLIFPVHPRTQASLDRAGHLAPAGLRTLPPLLYREFLWLVERARFVVTDSGGVQEECAALGRPCLTLRRETERLVTVRLGRNEVIGHEPAALLMAAERLLASPNPTGPAPEIPGWDGRAAERVMRDLTGWLRA